MDIYNNTNFLFVTFKSATLDAHYAVVDVEM